MAHKLIIRPKPEDDLADAHNWYENQMDGLGSDFLNAVEAAIFGIKRSPEAALVIHKQIRRQLVRRFPYGMFYVLNSETIVVLAVLHARRNPKAWKDRS